MVSETPALQRAMVTRMPSERSVHSLQNDIGDVSKEEPDAISPTAPYLIGISSQRAHRQLFDLFCERSLKHNMQLAYQRDDVWCLAGEANVKGSLFLISPRDDSAWAYIAWVPYCLLMSVNPDLMTPRGKRTLSIGGFLPIADDEGEYEGPFREEWKHAVLIPDSHLLAIHKSVKTFGANRITFVSSETKGGAVSDKGATHSSGPFLFHDGGMQKFIDELMKLVPLTPKRQDDKVLLVEHDVVNTVPAWSGSFNSKPSEATVPNGSTSPTSQLYDESSPVVANSSFADHRRLMSQQPQPQEMGAGKKAFRAIGEAFASAKASLTETPPTSPPFGESPTGSPRGKGTVLQRLQDSFVMITSPGKELLPDFTPDSLPLPSPEIPSPPLSRGQPLRKEEWESAFDAEGRLDKEKWEEFKSRIFEGGLEDEIRCPVWKYLLGVRLPGDSTAECKARKEALTKEYEQYKIQWQSITDRQKQRFAKFRDREQRIEKDVVRTDRAVDLFVEDDGEGMTRLKEILLTYSFFNFDLGYCQGMSDMLAPIYDVMRDEVEAFWAFSNLMDDRIGGNFTRDQRGMAEQLNQLAKLTELVDPELHAYLQTIDALNFCFCFRWVVVQFKREFTFSETLRLWDAFWACPFDTQYHLFTAATLLRLVRPQIVSNRMSFDEVLKFSNDISQKMTAEVALSHAHNLHRDITERYQLQLKGSRPSVADMLEYLDGKANPCGNSRPSDTKSPMSGASPASLITPIYSPQNLDPGVAIPGLTVPDDMDTCTG